MKDLYLVTHLGIYPSHTNCFPNDHPTENIKTDLRVRFLNYVPEIRDGKAIAVPIGQDRSWLDGILDKVPFFRFHGNWPADEEVKALNARLQGEEYQLVPVGFSSADCVPAIVGALLHGTGYRKQGQEITLTERLDVQGLKIIPELLFPPVEKLNLRQ